LKVRGRRGFGMDLMTERCCMQRFQESGLELYELKY
jgi:hypothetical protein